jgi:hypothetical protein
MFGGVRGEWLDKVFGSEEDDEEVAIRASAYPSSDETFAQLHAAGWSIGDASVLTPEGPRWRVTGANGENVIDATGETRAEAWRGAPSRRGRWGCSDAPPPLDRRPPESSDVNTTLGPKASARLTALPQFASACRTSAGCAN